MAQWMNPEPSNAPPRERAAADNDEAYTWGRSPSTYLAPREVARLMIFRSRLPEREALRRRAELTTDN